MNRPAVLVTDGHLRPALAVVRSLGKAGYRVFVCSTRARSLAGASRYAAAEALAADPMTQPGAFVSDVAALIAQWDIRILVPLSEEALLALMPAREQLGDVCLPFAPLEIFKRASDKDAVTALAGRLGIPVPEQIVITSAASARDTDFTALAYPLVLKPARSVAGEGAERAKFGVTYVHDRSELERTLAALPSAAFPILAQRRIVGPGTGVFLAVWDKQTIALFAHRRLREKPPSGGVSVCSESIAADPAVVEQARSLLAALDWRGPAMVEFKLDRATGRHYLMEINGRFWGSLQLAVDAGVDFPALLVAAARGELPAPVTSYRVGVRTRWWWGEVDHLVARLRGNGDTTELGGRLRAVQRFLIPEANARNEVFRADDARPFVRETIDWFRSL